MSCCSKSCNSRVTETLKRCCARASFDDAGRGLSSSPSAASATGRWCRGLRAQDLCRRDAAAPLSAIQITTAAGVCAAVDLFRQGALPQRASQTEQVALPTFCNRYGAAYQQGRQVEESLTTPPKPLRPPPTRCAGRRVWSARAAIVEPPTSQRSPTDGLHPDQARPLLTAPNSNCSTKAAPNPSRS